MKTALAILLVVASLPAFAARCGSNTTRTTNTKPASTATSAPAQGGNAGAGVRH